MRTALRAHLRARSRDDRGWSPIAVVVSIGIAVTVSTALVASTVTATGANRATMETEQANQVAREVLAKSDNLNWDQLGYPPGFVVNSTVEPPPAMCRRTLVNGKCPRERTVRIAQTTSDDTSNRPVRDSMSWLGSWTAPGSVEGVEFQVTSTVSWMPGGDNWTPSVGLWPRYSKRVLVDVVWLHAGELRRVTLQRIREPGDVRTCGAYSSAVMCVNFVVSQGAERLDYLPVVKSGSTYRTNAEAIEFYAQGYAQVNPGVSGSAEVFAKAVRVRPFGGGGAWYDMKYDHTRQRWYLRLEWTAISTAGDQTINGAARSGTAGTAVETTWSDGSLTTSNLWMRRHLSNGTTKPSTIVSFNAEDQGERNPDHEWGPLIRTGLSSGAGLAGTVYDRICVNSAGYMLSDYTFYFRTYGTDYRNQGWTKPEIDIELSHTSATPANRIPSPNKPVVNSSPLRGAVDADGTSEDRWAVNFYRDQYRVLTGNVTFALIARRNLDGATGVYSVNIPVYVATSMSNCASSNTRMS